MVNEAGPMALRTADGEWRTAHEFVRETLRQAILRGDLTGGSRLIQADLATQLRVSTTPVREALRDLATEGLITLDRHRGGVVRELNWDDMEEIRQIRQQLEPLAISMAVAGVTADQLTEAEALCDRMADIDDLASWVALNLRFHSLFHEATGAKRLAGILTGLEEAASVYVAQAQRSHPEIRRRANAAHRALIEACRDRDVDKAIAAMEGHVGMPIEMTDPGERRAPESGVRDPKRAAGLRAT
jgi:DNA-binding GntR family transcriptional regulator